MDFILNERLDDFFLGDDSAWDDVTFHFYDQMLSYLIRNFSNVPIEELENAVTDWFFEIRQKVIGERNRIETEAKNKNHSPPEIRESKLRECAKIIGFKPAEGTFENWVKTILYRRAIDCWRKINRRKEVSIDGENFAELNDAGNSADEMEALILMKEFKKLLFSALDENERLYYRIWIDYGCLPSANDVRKVFKKVLDKELSDSSITFMKHRFIRIVGLVLIRIEFNASRLKEMFLRYISSSDDENNFFDDMMRLIWQDFYNDSGSREESRQRISPDLWLRWEGLVQRKRIQSQILVAAYRYFRAKAPRPSFCRSIELYADHKFGKKVRDLFFEGNTARENE